jgi:hypothetical protein
MVGTPAITISTTTPQVITFKRGIRCFEIRQLNLQDIAQSWENSTAACKVLPSGADLAALVGSQSYATPYCMGPQHCRDGKLLYAKIKDFSALLDNKHDAVHSVAIYSSTWECIKHNSRTKTYISDDQLHPMVLCNQPAYKVQVEGLDDERISQMC